MGIRGEIFTKSIPLQNRTYFFNVKENRMGDIYLNIVESKNRDTGGFDRQSVIMFADDMPEILKGFDEALRSLEKAVREKRRSGKDGNSRPGGKPEQGARPPSERSGPRKIAAGTRKHDGKFEGKRDGKFEPKQEGKREGRRIVVKKSRDS